jgi:hypothetical protein
MVEQSDITFIRMLSQKIQGIPNRQPCEERDDIKAEKQDVIQLDSESAQCVDKILRIPHMV